MQVRRSYHVHPPGVVYAAVATLLGVGAINSQNNLLFILFGVALGALVVSGIISGMMMMGLRLERVLPATAQVGRPTRISYRLHNRNRISAAFALSIRELSGSFEGGPARAFAVHVPPRGSSTTQATLRCARRGELELGRVRVSTTFPFGIVMKSVGFDLPATLLVHPRIVPLRRDVLRALLARGAAERQLVRRRGAGLEFYALREYRPGDATRQIAWKASARTGALRSREMTAPGNRSLLLRITLDRIETPSGEPSSALERGLSLAASLVALAVQENVDVGLHLPQLAVLVKPAGGQRQLVRLLDALATIDASDARLLRACLPPPPAAPRGTASPPPLAGAGPAAAGAGAARFSANDLARLGLEREAAA